MGLLFVVGENGIGVGIGLFFLKEDLDVGGEKKMVGGVCCFFEGTFCKCQ